MSVILDYGSRSRAVLQTFCTARAYFLPDFIEMPRLQIFLRDRPLWAHLTAQSTGVADGIIETYLHAIPHNWCKSQSTVSSTGFWVSGVVQSVSIWSFPS